MLARPTRVWRKRPFRRAAVAGFISFLGVGTLAILGGTGAFGVLSRVVGTPEARRVIDQVVVAVGEKVGPLWGIGSGNP